MNALTVTSEDARGILSANSPTRPGRQERL
jgi:hypothetical protein